MEFKQLFDENRAVSPVIGVILMVAITVILAAVIGTFVLGLGQDLGNSSPTASIGFDVTNNKQNVTIVHQSGESLNADNVNVKVSTQVAIANASSGWTNSSTGYNLGETGYGTLTAGDTVEIGHNSGLGGETIRVTWSSANSDKTATLGKTTVPN